MGLSVGSGGIKISFLEWDCFDGCPLALLNIFYKNIERKVKCRVSTILIVKVCISLRMESGVVPGILPSAFRHSALL